MCCKTDRSACDHVGNAGKNVLDRHGVKVFRKRATRILGEKHFISMFPRLTRRRFDTKISRNPAKDNRAYPSTPKLQIELGAMKGAPLAFGNDDIFWLGETLNELRPTGWQAAFGESKGLVHKLAWRIGEILRKSNMNEDHQSASRSEASGECLSHRYGFWT